MFTEIIPSWFWTYLYHMLGNWAGLLLAIDGFVALVERYLGEIVEKLAGRKIRTPFGLKIGFAVVVLFIAQVLAYRDLQGQLLQEVANNDQLRKVIAKNETRLQGWSKKIQT